jgi:Shikimate 5-dehydrogenase
LNINAKTKVYGLIGNPIENSLSAQIHNKLAQIFFFDMIYVPFQVIDSDQNKIFSALRQLNISGVNITSPCKNLKNLSYFKDADENVRAIGAVNTIKNINGELFAFNTDVFGIEKTFEIHQINVNQKNILVFGSGGGAKAAIYAISKKSPATIYIANRTLENADKLVKLFEKKFSNVKYKALYLEQICDINKKIYLAIQATTLGFKNNLSPVKNIDFFSEVEIAFDLIYSPWKTKFLNDSEKFNVKSINGFEMLIYQAIKSFEIWNNVKVDKKIESDLFDYMKRFI